MSEPSTVQLGPYRVANRLVLAPMAGISDRPFRELCLLHGAGLAVAEMIPCDSGRWESRKNRNRLRHSKSQANNIVQIAGSDPQMMADAARLNVEMGADAIDINMGCPAKKVLQKAAGSALLRDRDLVKQILDAVVAAVDVPVTLKIRTGWSRESRNGVDIACIAQDAGIRLLTVHGRTRECRFMGEAEYDTIAAIKEAVEIPVIANGDITDPVKAREVLEHTRADGLMIGRAAQGRPWIFRETQHFLSTGELLAEPSVAEKQQLITAHIRSVHAFYGEFHGVLFARKHLSWYCRSLPEGNSFKSRFNHLESPHSQLECIQEYFENLRFDKEIAA